MTTSAIGPKGTAIIKSGTKTIAIRKMKKLTRTDLDAEVPESR
jgi:hypothetical protein